MITGDRILVNVTVAGVIVANTVVGNRIRMIDKTWPLC